MTAQAISDGIGHIGADLGRLFRDARHYQIVTLALLLAVNGIWNDFHASIPQFFAAITATLATQYIAGRIVGLDHFDFRSPLISGFSLTLLLRSNDIWLFALAGVIAIATKFIIRVNDKHIFNPANIAIVLLLLAAGDMVWVSPGQWGHEIWVMFMMACLGFMVLYRCGRMDISLFFMGAYAAILFGRAIWLGDPWAIPLHHMNSGTLLIFAFFMISDPKTIPDSRKGRFWFAAAVAALSLWLQIEFQVREGLFYALPVMCLCVPVMDKIWRGVRFEWGADNTPERTHDHESKTDSIYTYAKEG